MKRSDMGEAVVDSRKAGQLWLFVLVGLLLPLVLAFDVQLAVPVTDSFHEGEYLGGIEAMRQFLAGQGSFPLLIHGAMDYLPALWAAGVGDGDRVVVLTRFVNVAAVAACWILWIDLARLALRRHGQRVVWSMVFLVVFLLMAGAAGSDPVRKQQAFLGTRDVFLLLSLWTGLQACEASGKRGALAALAAGLFAALSLYWSYDRGLLSAVWVLVLAVGWAMQGRRLLAAGLLVAYGAALWGISLCGVAGSLGDNWRNIAYWLASTGDVWRMSASQKAPALPGAVAMLLFGLLVCFGAGRTAFRDLRRPRVPMIAGLIAIQFVFFTKLYSLPGFPTTYYYIWPSILLLVLAPPQSSALASLEEALRRSGRAIWSGERQGEAHWRRWSLIALVGLFMSNALVSSALSARSVLKPISDRVLLPESRYGLDAMAGLRNDCIFQWSNEGVFTFAAKRPHCLPYTYAVYISRAEEAAALAALRLNPPGLVIYDSPNWSMAIYGRPMRERLPLIDRFIQERYELRATNAGYVFAVLRPTSPTPSQP